MRNFLTTTSAAAVLATSLGGAAFAASHGGYTIGISNTVQGNGWREEMVCAMKAQALVSGKVDSLNIAHRNTDAAGQLEDIRNLNRSRCGRNRSEPVECGRRELGY